MLIRLVDVGIAVEDLDAAIHRYVQILGANPAILPTEYYAYPGLKGARFDLGNASISLVASMDENTPVARFISKRGEGVNHLTFEVTDLNNAIEGMAKEGIKFITDEPLSFAEGKVIFSHPHSLHGVQIAFMERCVTS